MKSEQTTYRVSDEESLLNRHSVLPFKQEEERNILIVDDEDGVRRLFKMHLCEHYPCATAASVEEALWILEKTPFALVLTDIIMPGRSGIELLREVKKNYPETVAVVISGMDRTQRILDAVRLGAYDYLLKPIDLYVLDATVERALQHRALLNSARIYKQELKRRNLELVESKAKLEESKAQLERLQSQITQNEKMASLGQLAAGVAHELNNPAGFILGNMEILRDGATNLEKLFRFYQSLPLTEEQTVQISNIRSDACNELKFEDLHSIVADCCEGAERIREVVQNLKIFSRLDKTEFKKVDIHEGLESTIRLLSNYYNTGQINLERDYGELPVVDCFAGQLNQVWLNLLVNAAHALKDGGVVKIRTQSEGDKVVVTISDNGCGIPSQNLNRIFDSFFTTKPVGEGTGLGLSVTYGIIERHGGTICVESQVNKGTTFTISLPTDIGASRRVDEEKTDEFELHEFVESAGLSF